MHKIKEEVDQELKKIEDEGLTKGNIELLYTLVDIKKDIGEIEKGEKEMRYDSYNNYSRYENGDYSRGGYGRGEYGTGEYGRRGNYRARGNYRGSEDLEEMMNQYNNYMMGREEYNRGNYSAKDDELKALDYMLRSVENFVCMLKEDAGSQEEVEMIKKAMKRTMEAI